MSRIAWAASQSFVTYESGFKHPVPPKGRLETFDLSMSLVNAADLELVRADHPDAKITTITPAEELKNALAEFETNKKSSK
jgi:hypothetical protein